MNLSLTYMIGAAETLEKVVENVIFAENLKTREY